MRAGRLAVGALAVAGVVAAALWLLTAPDPLTADAVAAAAPGHAPDPANGQVLFHAGGCASCHAAPDAEGEARLVLAGGLGLETAFGTFVAPNISPGPQGIGGWSDADFVNAMQRGLAPDGRHYYPAFPYTSYQRMTVPDLLDLKAYLDTLPASDAANRPHAIAFPYSVRRGLGLWKRLHLDGEPFAADPAWSAEVARGAYLVEGPGHCQECHTARGRLGGRIEARAFAGAPMPTGEGFNPNITPHADGIGGWSAGELAFLLETGFTPEFDSVGGEMAAVVANFAQLGAADREAVAAYLLTLPPLPTQR